MIENITSLRYFVAIAQERNITKASERLYVSQPTLSRHLSMLEKELSVELFIRHKSTLEMTPAGKELLKRAKEIIRLTDQLPAVMENYMQKNDLKIGIVPILMPIRFTSAISRFDPHDQIEYIPGSIDDMQQYLEEGKADLVLSGESEGRWKNTEEIRIGSMQFKALVKSSHQGVIKDCFDILELQKKPLVYIRSENARTVPKDFFTYCSSKNIQPRLIEVENAMELFIQVASRDVVGIGYETSRFALSEDLCWLKIDGFEHAETLTMRYKKDNDNPELKRLLKLLAKELR